MIFFFFVPKSFWTEDLILIQTN